MDHQYNYIWMRTSFNLHVLNMILEPNYSFENPIVLEKCLLSTKKWRLVIPFFVCLRKHIWVRPKKGQIQNSTWHNAISISSIHDIWCKDRVVVWLKVILVRQIIIYWRFLEVDTPHKFAWSILPYSENTTLLAVPLSIRLVQSNYAQTWFHFKLQISQHVQAHHAQFCHQFDRLRNHF